jgi:sucrose phosphorylase
VFHEYTRLLRLRAQHPAFHPDGGQRVLQLDDGLFAIERSSPDGTEQLLCINNLTCRCQQLAVEAVGRTAADGRWHDLISGENHQADVADELTLQPFQTAWLAKETIP